MIKDIKRLQKKYENISKHSEYVNIAEVLSDLYHLLCGARLKRISKDER